MSKIEQLMEAVKEANKTASDEMLRMYPIGSVILFTIMHGQRNASSGTFLCAGYQPGYVRVKHHEAKPRSRYQFRDIHHSYILSFGNVESRPV